MTYRFRRARCGALTAALLCFFCCSNAFAFAFADVAKHAMQLAAEPFKKPESNLPRELQKLDYDQYRDIRFRPEYAYWRDAGLPFELAFYHRGSYYDLPVRINEIRESDVREVPFSPSAFDYGKNKIDPQQMQDTGFAGFRVHYAVNKPEYKDEVLVFLGASYFRAVGGNQRYGVSARALAIDTGLPSGEEFPRFVEFWIERPTASATELVIYGLLDSPRATAAYRFILKPGAATALDVKAQLYLRDGIAKLGLAPLNSMFFFGDNQRSAREDYRPEVHDSDGLSVQLENGEWLWRPLVNPKKLLITAFAATNPAGFGLMQRDRDFSNYEDLEARFELRPSAWVETKGQWGAGRVELVQIPSPDETNDNIVAFWSPDNPPPPGKPYDLEYRLWWQSAADRLPPMAWVTQTRRGYRQTRNEDEAIGLTIDFAGPALEKLPADAKLEGVVMVDGNAKLLEHLTYRNEVIDGWRMTLRLRRIDEDKPIELRGYLREGNNTVSEIWSYIVPAR